MKHVALILVLLMGLALKATSVMGAEEASLDSAESTDLAHYQPMPQNNASAAAAASASANSNWVNQPSNDQWVDVNPNQNQTIQNNNNITVGPNATAANANNMNQGHIPATPAVAGAVAYASDDVSSVLGTREHYVDRRLRLGITPLVGGTWYATDWNDHIGNNYTFGAILDIPMNSYLSAEFEGGYARYNISYGYAPGYPAYNHYFDQYLFGGNLKAYLTRTTFRPFLGGGLMGVCYNGMSRGPSYPVSYNHCIGSAQLIAGAEVFVSDDIAIGARGAYLIPVFNRPYTMSNGYTSAPGFEEAGAINTSFYKLMATLRIAL